MTNGLFCLFEDENKNCVEWRYPPRFVKNLTLGRWIGPRGGVTWDGEGWMEYKQCGWNGSADGPRDGGHQGSDERGITLSERSGLDICLVAV